MVVLNMLPHISELEEKDLNYFYPKDIYPVVLELSAKWRGVKFGEDTSVFFGRYFIYFDGDDYARGIVHTELDKEGNIKYFVASPRIENRRYRENSYDHYTLGSTKFKTAVKNAMKYCTPVPLHDIVHRMRFDISSSFSHINTGLRMKLSRLGRNITHDSALLNELVDMYKAGHVFKSGVVNEAMPELIEAKDKYDEFKSNSKARMVFVHLHVDESVSLVKLPELSDDAWQAGCKHYVLANSRKLKHHSELGEDIQGKIALLQMNNQIGDYVLGVGTMLNQYVWVVHGEY